MPGSVPQERSGLLSGWIAVQTFVGFWLGLVVSVWQGDRRIRKMRLP